MGGDWHNTLQDEEYLAKYKAEREAEHNEDTIMVFGKHKGKRLGDIPSWWFRWFVQQDWADKWPGLKKYAEMVSSSSDLDF